MRSPRLNAILALCMLVMIPLVFVTFFELRELRSSVGRFKMYNGSEGYRVVGEKSGRSLESDLNRQEGVSEQAAYPLEECMSNTAFLLFGDSTIRGIADCMIAAAYGDTKGRMLGDIHDLQHHTSDNYRVFFQYYPQLASDYKLVYLPLRYRRGEVSKEQIQREMKVTEKQLNVTGNPVPPYTERPIDFLEALTRAYRKYGDRKRVVLLVGGIGLTSPMIKSVFDWQRDHLSMFHIIIKGNGPRLPMLQEARPHHAALCFGEHRDKNSSSSSICPKLRKWEDDYMATNAKFRQLVDWHIKQGEGSVSAEWMDVDEMLFPSWPEGVRYDHCMCHYHYFYDGRLNCGAQMYDMLQDFLGRACVKEFPRS